MKDTVGAVSSRVGDAMRCAASKLYNATKFLSAASVRASGAVGGAAGRSSAHLAHAGHTVG